MCMTKEIASYCWTNLFRQESQRNSTVYIGENLRFVKDKMTKFTRLSVYLPEQNQRNKQNQQKRLKAFRSMKMKHENK